MLLSGIDTMSRAMKRGLRRLLKVAVRPMKSERAHGGRVIHSYRGYGSRTEVFLIGRVFRQPGLNLPTRQDSLMSDLVDLVRRSIRWGIHDVEVEIRVNDTRCVVTTDRYGYFHANIELDEPLPADRVWHQADFRLLTGSGDPGSRRARATAGATASTDIYVPPPDVDRVVISDIDDTVMHTGVANKLTMFYRLFFEKAERRTAFPGVASFYQGLHEGADGQRQRPMLYVSRGPWSIYEVLETFFQINRIPVGPVLFLREWGLTLQHPMPQKAEDHKQTLIEKMLSLYEDMPFVLIGDSGQHDPEVYAQIVRDHPGRISNIYIRDVSRDGRRSDAIRELADEVSRSDCTLTLAEDSATLAEHAHQHGLVSKSCVEQTRAEGEQQRRRHPED
ncbi:App1 family protein [Kushneria phosphatilytica]|nr:phosphatase domain-containing protein [Kushneria phosphatilytica]